jgi:ATP-binding cassette subfamily B protein
MTAQTAETISEFSFKTKYKSNRSSAGRWILSHAIHQWPWILMAVIGAIGNAALASVVPIYIGKAFNEILKKLKKRSGRNSMSISWVRA